MKILITAHQFLPDYSSGTEILALHSALEMKARGHEIRVMAAFPAPDDTTDGDRFDRYEYQGIPVTRFRHAHVPMGDQANVVEQEYDNRFSARRFEALLDEYRPDLVHFFHLMRLSASIADVCADRGVPTVLTPTDFWFVCPTCQLRLPDGRMCPGPDPVASNCVRHLARLKGPRVAANLLARLPDGIVRGLVRSASRPPFQALGPARLVSALSRRHAFLRERLNRIDRVLPPTRTMQETLLRHGLDPAHSRLTPYGIRSPAPAPRNRDPRKPLTLGMIGLGEHKGAHVLIKAARKLPEADLRIMIYGRPSDFPDYTRQIMALAQDDPRISFRGGFDNDRIGELLSELDALVVPSLWFENAPLVIYSAQAAACPVIGSDMPGISELIANGDNGLLFPAGDADRLVEILARLAADGEEITRLSSRARAPKTISAYADDLLAVYDELLRERVHQQ